MACKGSGVQIPSAPPQVSGPLRRRPPTNRSRRAADRQQSVLRGRSSVRHGGPASQHRWRRRPADRGATRAAAGGPVVRDEGPDRPGTARSITHWPGPHPCQAHSRDAFKQLSERWPAHRPSDSDRGCPLSTVRVRPMWHTGGMVRSLPLAVTSRSVRARRPRSAFPGPRSALGSDRW